MAEGQHATRSPDALVRAIINRKYRDTMTPRELAPPLPISPPLTIALSREAGTRASQVAHEIGARLGWPVFDRELLECVAQDMGLRTSLLEAVDEKHVSWIEETIEAFGSALAVSETECVIHLVRTVLSLGVHGDCVIVGRGSAHVLPPATTLRVRLIASLGDRTQALIEKRKIDFPSAQRRLQEIDLERARFVSDHFHKATADPQNYDLLVSMSRFTVPESAAVIVGALQQLKTRGSLWKGLTDATCQES